MTHNRLLSLADYNVHTTQTSSSGSKAPSAWQHYHANIRGFSTQHAPKVHISLEQTPENLVRAQKVIESILVDYQLIAVKITTIQSLKNSKAFDELPDDYDIPNVSGKEITLYMRTRIEANNKDPEFWKKLLIDLEQRLKAANVKPNPKFKALGDVPIPGSEWISSRDQNNVFAIYIEAEELKEQGFTRYEAAHLTGEFKRFMCIPDIKVKNKDEKVIGIKLSERIPKHDGILNRYKMNLQDCYKIFFGTDKIDDVTFNRNYVFPFLYLFNKDKDLIRFRLEGLLTFLDDCLVEAAKYTALLRKSLHDEKMIPNDKAIELGNILPAIYHHLIKPMVQKAVRRGSDLYVADANRKQLIREIVKCSFRQGKQIDADIPRYMYGLNDATLDKLLEEIELRNSFSHQAKEFFKVTLGSMFQSGKPAAEALKPPQPVDANDKKANKPK